MTSELLQISSALDLACAQDPGLYRIPGEPAAMVRQLVQRNAQLLRLVRLYERIAPAFKVMATEVGT